MVPVLAKILLVLFASLPVTLVCLGLAISAEVYVGNGVYLPAKRFDAPKNEQPFYGFSQKSAEEEEADRVLLNTVTTSKYAKEDWFDAIIADAWNAVGSKDYSAAAQRFNQANLNIPAHPAVLHGFAVVTHLGFEDSKYAEEISKAGVILKDRPTNYMADFGRFLLVVGKHKEALPVLEQAVVDAVNNPTAWSNLAFARYYSGKNKEACLAAKEADKLASSPELGRDIQIAKTWANCQTTAK